MSTVGPGIRYSSKSKKVIVVTTTKKIYADPNERSFFKTFVDTRSTCTDNKVLVVGLWPLVFSTSSWRSERPSKTSPWVFYTPTVFTYSNDTPPSRPYCLTPTSIVTRLLRLVCVTISTILPRSSDVYDGVTSRRTITKKTKVTWTWITESRTGSTTKRKNPHIYRYLLFSNLSLWVNYSLRHISSIFTFTIFFSKEWNFIVYLYFVSPGFMTSWFSSHHILLDTLRLPLTSFVCINRNMRSSQCKTLPSSQ